MMRLIYIQYLFILFLLPGSFHCPAQFLDEFSGNEIEGWFFFTGDGDAIMDFVQKKDCARIEVDATHDRFNVWWALIKRDVTNWLDLEKLQDPAFELRVEARVRISHAPRRVNFMVNTNRTTNYHEHLKEYDIPDTSGWHIISMTTHNFDAVPGDTVYVQLAMTDFGPGKYYLDVDYYRADVVDVSLAGPDLGEPLPYHPTIQEPGSFEYHLRVGEDAMIDCDFPEVNFNNWSTQGPSGEERILTVDANHWPVLRWDFGPYVNLKVKGAGILELTTQTVASGGGYIEAFGEDLGIEFGKIRVIEILKGDPLWNQEDVTYNSMTQNQPEEVVFNTQMIYDEAPCREPGCKTYITISRPVLQRLLDGTTKGLLIRPLGAIDASFYASENIGRNGPVLHFNCIPENK
jgi:hypothetical protein